MLGVDLLLSNFDPVKGWVRFQETMARHTTPCRDLDGRPLTGSEDGNASARAERSEVNPHVEEHLPTSAISAVEARTDLPVGRQSTPAICHLSSSRVVPLGNRDRTDRTIRAAGTGAGT